MWQTSLFTRCTLPILLTLCCGCQVSTHTGMYRGYFSCRKFREPQLVLERAPLSDEDPSLWGPRLKTHFLRWHDRSFDDPRYTYPEKSPVSQVSGQTPPKNRVAQAPVGEEHPSPAAGANRPIRLVPKPPAPQEIVPEVPVQIDALPSQPMPPPGETIPRETVPSESTPSPHTVPTSPALEDDNEESPLAPRTQDSPVATIDADIEASELEVTESVEMTKPEVNLPVNEQELPKNPFGLRISRRRVTERH